MPPNTRRFALHGLVLACAAMLLLRVDMVPDWFYAREIRLTPLDRPFDLFFSGEKVVLLPFLLLGIAGLYRLQLHRGSLRGTLRSALLATLLGSAALVGPALAIGYVAFEPKFPALTGMWIVHNLAFVCVFEELFFRNYLFEALRRAFQSLKRPGDLALVASSLLFGIAHLRGGPAYVLLATIAGIAYGQAYRRGGLAAAVLAHFGVNLIHFLAFSYPALR